MKKGTSLDPPGTPVLRKRNELLCLTGFIFVLSQTFYIDECQMQTFMIIVVSLYFRFSSPSSSSVPIKTGLGVLEIEMMIYESQYYPHNPYYEHNCRNSLLLVLHIKYEAEQQSPLIFIPVFCSKVNLSHNDLITRLCLVISALIRV